MAEQLDAKTAEQMRALCRTVSVAHDLDAEIQEELYGHMEDKLLAYMSGDEPITEADAFILVREHFGDPRALKGLLRQIHACEARISFARRVAAAIVASVVPVIAWNVLYMPVLWVLVDAFDAHPSRIPPLLSEGFFAASAFLWIAAAALTWGILYRWQRGLDAGRSLWFVRWRPVRVTLLAVALLLLVVVACGTPSYPSGRGWLSGLYHGTSWRLAVILQCLAWLWWCDKPPRAAKTLLYGAVCWFAFTVGTSLLGIYLRVFVAVAKGGSQLLQKGAILFYVQGDVPGKGVVREAAWYGGNLLFYVQGDVPGTKAHWCVPFLQQFDLASAFLARLPNVIERLLPLALVACLVYVVARYVWRVRSQRNEPLRSDIA